MIGSRKKRQSAPSVGPKRKGEKQEKEREKEKEKALALAEAEANSSAQAPLRPRRSEKATESGARVLAREMGLDPKRADPRNGCGFPNLRVRYPAKGLPVFRGGVSPLRLFPLRPPGKNLDCQNHAGSNLRCGWNNA